MLPVSIEDRAVEALGSGGDRRGAEREGFISPNPRFSVPLRLAVGLGYWTLMLLFLGGKLIPRPKAAGG